MTNEASPDLTAAQLRALYESVGMTADEIAEAINRR